MEVSAVRLLTALLSVTEKAATLARVVRSEKDLFDLLIEEKRDETKNTKFQVDFKTLADVLIQEMVRYDISCQFPRIQDHIYGEESNKFTTVDGETITLKIGPTKQDTASLIARVLPSQDKSAELLADVVHRDSKHELSQEMREKMKNILVDESRLGVWIDPIDSTNEYVQGTMSFPDNGIHPYGIHCVTVLVGVFDRVSGEPLLGVINQPFCHLGDDKLWYGRCIWGLALGDCKLFDIPSLPYTRDSNSTKVCVIGQKEQKSIINKLTSSGWRVCQITGCGYKLLCVADKVADAYILSQSSSFKWDTCGPQAILKALGGNVITFATKDEKRRELVYHQPDEPVKPGGEYWRNEGGIIGYISPVICQSLCDVLQC